MAGSIDPALRGSAPPDSAPGAPPDSAPGVLLTSADVGRVVDDAPEEGSAVVGADQPVRCVTTEPLTRRRTVSRHA